MLGGRYPFDGKAMPLEESVTAQLRLSVVSAEMGDISGHSASVNISWGEIGHS